MPFWLSGRLAFEFLLSRFGSFARWSAFHYYSDRNRARSNGESPLNWATGRILEPRCKLLLLRNEAKVGQASRLPGECASASRASAAPTRGGRDPCPTLQQPAVSGPGRSSHCADTPWATCWACGSSPTKDQRQCGPEILSASTLLSIKSKFNQGRL